MKNGLPISKSIANRLLICKAMRGDDLSEVIASPAFSQYPDDVRLMAEHLATMQSARPHVLDCQNAGTVMRFLCAFAAQKEGLELTLTGCERMMQRPIGQLVEALRKIGADIRYLGEEGFPPLRIIGKPLDKTPLRMCAPQPSTQFISALLLAGIAVETNVQSPYIDLTRSVIRDFQAGRISRLEDVEKDWSSAAFWLEREAVGLPIPEEIFSQLRADSEQGDKVAQTLFEQIRSRSLTAWDFSACPDLYPAAAVACSVLGLQPAFSGLQTLRLKESDRIAAVEEGLRLIARDPHAVVKTHADHRIAMAFLAAGFRVDNTACISKSYPAFLSELLDCERLVALREGDPMPVFQDGLFTRVQTDAGKGKKQALLRAMPLIESEFVWLCDADILPPPMPASLPDADLIILPLRMESNNTFFSELLTLEYAAIQSLTMLAAEKGHPILCSGANMIVRRSAWEECAGAIRQDIPSGDDMFILEEMKRRGKTIVAGPASLTATCFAPHSLPSLLKQRARWAGKAPAYQDREILLTGGWTVLSNLFVYLLPGWAFIKWVADMLLVERHHKQYAYPEKCGLKTWLWGAVLTVVYPLWMLLCLSVGLFRKKW